MTSDSHLNDSMYEEDPFAAGQSLEEELLGKGYFMDAALGSSLAAELHSATNGPPLSPPVSSNGNSKLASMAMNRSTSSSMLDRPASPYGKANPPVIDLHKFGASADGAGNGEGEDAAMAVRLPRGMDPFSNQTSPTMSPSGLQQWSTVMSTSTSHYGRSRRSSFSSTWSSLDAEDDDPFEMLKRQLEELNSSVWETKTLHKRLFNTLLADDLRTRANRGSTTTNGSGSGNFAPPLELVITSVANLVESKARDRERQTSYLRNLDNQIRQQVMWMNPEVIRDLEVLFASIKSTLHHPAYSYENPLPAIRKLKEENSSMTESLEELKEIMYVSKRQVQELNSRLRSIAKTVHEVRKDIRRINKFLEEKDDDDEVVLEKGEAQERVKVIMWELNEMDEKSSREIRKMQLSLEGDLDEAVASASS